MDDEKEYEELVKAEAQEERSTNLVMGAFKAIMILLGAAIIGIAAYHVFYFVWP